MKRIIVALLLVCALTLTGCASMLNRGNLVVTPHNEIPAAEENSSILRVENYQDLVNGILYFVLEGREKGTIRLYNYARDVDDDLNAACIEVAQEDPIGAYALDYIKFEVAQIIHYYEVQLFFTYRRSQEQVDSIVSVVGTNAIRQELQEALTAFRPEVTLRIGYFTGDEAYLHDLLRKAYYNTPWAAFGHPQASISIYPDSGYPRVVEFQLTYQNTLQQLNSLQARLRNKVTLETRHIHHLQPEESFREIYYILHGNTKYDPEGNAALQFLLAGLPANSEGLALAASLYAQELGLTCQVVEGTLNGQPHFWNIVRTSFGYRHIDFSQPEAVFRSDLAMTQLGFDWEKTYVPQCVDPSELSSTLPSDPYLNPEISLEVFKENS